MKNTQTLNIIKQSLYSTKISRMLAHENIAVVFSETAHTASFSPETRTLTFPNSTLFLDQDIHELFMVHEVSHALHLPTNVFDIVNDNKIDANAFNIIIDIRDERLIKKIYPGVVPAMQRGYEKLLEQKFFGPTSEIIFKSFANRLNIFAKCGIKSAWFITFSVTEMEFYNRCMLAETIDDCISLSKELMDWKDSCDMDALKEFVLQQYEENDDGTKELTAQEKHNAIMDTMDRIRNECVQESFDKSFKESIISNSLVVSYKSMNRSEVDIVSYKKYNDYVKRCVTSNAINDIRESRRGIQTAVDSMVRVFESKKAAEQYKNARQSTTGSVDMTKIHRYKFDDKIFKKAMKIPNSKNHGYFILLDFSGSMTSIFEHVISQVVTLTEFFRKINVPYKVVAFGASIDDSLYHPKHTGTFTPSPMPGIVRAHYNECLMEVLSNEQTTLEHNTAIAGLNNQVGFNLGSTPTGYAMLAAEHVATEFFNRHVVSKKHMIVITDGSPTDITTWGTHGKTFIMTDSETKSHTIFKGNSIYSVINAIGKIFEYRHNITLTTLSITSSLSENKIINFLQHDITDADRKCFRDKKYAKLTDQYCKNDIYFVKPSDIDNDITSFDISDKNTTTQIARSILKNMKNITKSRSFLNAIAETLS